MPVADQPLAAVLDQFVSMSCEQSCNLGLDRLRQQRSRAVAQHLGQGISKSSWLAERENVSLGHGVSLLRWRGGSFEHPHDTPPYLLMPSPTFAHSSWLPGSDNACCVTFRPSQTAGLQIGRGCAFSLHE